MFTFVKCQLQIATFLRKVLYHKKWRVTNFIFFEKKNKLKEEKEIEQAKHGNWQYWSIKMSFAKWRSSINQYENNKLIKSTCTYCSNYANCTFISALIHRLIIARLKNTKPNTMSMKCKKTVLLAFGILAFTGLCTATSHSNSRTKRFITGVDLEKVRKDLIDPSSISNQITGAVVFPSIMVFGWVFGGEYFMN